MGNTAGLSLLFPQASLRLPSGNGNEVSTHPTLLILEKGHSRPWMEVRARFEDHGPHPSKLDQEHLWNMQHSGETYL